MIAMLCPATEQTRLTAAAQPILTRGLHRMPGLADHLENGLVLGYGQSGLLARQENVEGFIVPRRRLSIQRKKLSVEQPFVTVR